MSTPTPTQPAFTDVGPNDAASDYNTAVFVINSILAHMQTATIAQVKGVNASAGTVDIKVLVNLQSANGTAIPHDIIYGLPFFRLQGGSNAVIVDPKIGDIGPAVFCSRDISSVVAAKGQANPGSARRFDWSDGLYFGGLLNGDPQQYLKFTDTGIILLSPDSIKLDAPLTEVTGDLLVDGDTTVTGDTTLTGATTAVGPIAATAITATGVITAGGFSGPGGTSPAGPPGPPGPTGPQGPAFLDVSDGTHSGSGITSMIFNGATVAISGTTANVTISGSGSGTVTSVGLSSSAFFTLGGTNPVTGAGTISIDLSSAFQAALAVTAALAVSALQPASIPLTTKGDLFGFSTADVRVPVGSNGQVLTADNTAAAGVSWQPGGGGGGSGPAGVSENLFYWFQADKLTGSSGSTLLYLPNSLEALSAYSSFVIGSGLSGATLALADLNGLNTANFGGTGQSRYGMISPTAFSLTLANTTCFYVIKLPSPATAQVLLAGQTGSFQIGTDGTGKMAIVSDLVAVLAVNASNLPTATYFQQNVTWNNSANLYAFRTSQAADGSGSGSGSSVSQPSNFIGWNQPAGVQDLAANVAEFIIYNRVLSSAEILAVETYLNSKWGV